MVNKIKGAKNSTVLQALLYLTEPWLAGWLGFNPNHNHIYIAPLRGGFRGAMVFSIQSRSYCAFRAITNNEKLHFDK